MNILNAMNTMNIDTEVAILQTEAVSKLKPDVVARTYVNKYLATMPVMFTQPYTLKFVSNDDRPTNNIKQSGNLGTALWVITLQLTMTSGSTSYTALHASFKEWVAKNTVVTNDINEERWARAYLKKLHSLNMIGTEITEHSVMIQRKEVEVKGYQITSHVRTKLDDIYDDLAEKAQMVCRPLSNIPTDWTSRTDGIGKLANMMFIPKPSRIQREIPQQVLDSVNKLQRVAYKRNPVMVEVAERNLSNGRGNNEAQASYNAVIALPSSDIHFPLTLDVRGRMYPRGGVSTYQGTDFDKASYMFAVGRPLGKTGFDAIQIQVANCLGYDKLALVDRLSAVQSEIDSGLLEHKTLRKLEQAYPRADIYQTYVAVEELRSIIQWSEDGNDIELYVSHLICHRDGTANGIQHMSAITQSESTAKAVNCVASTEDETPTDIYEVISQTAIKLATSDDVRMALVKYGRNITKKPIMIRSYGAGADTIAEGIVEFLLDAKDTSGVSAEAIAKAIIKAIEEQAEAVRRLFDDISRKLKAHMQTSGIQIPDRNQQDVPTEQEYSVSWTTADGFPVDIEQRDSSELVVLAGAYSAKILGDTKLDKVKTQSALPPNFVHSIDATHIRMVALACDWELATVHDSIGSHASTYFDTGRIIREQFVELHSYDAIQNLYDGLGAKNYFEGDYDVTDALDALYMFS